MGVIPIRDLARASPTVRGVTVERGDDDLTLIVLGTTPVEADFIF